MLSKKSEAKINNGDKLTDKNCLFVRQDGSAGDCRK